jgi:response regulator RpfG family c-di-GMP phosphodiesterase
MAFEAAVAELVRCRGAQFDPDMVAGLVRNQDQVREAMTRCAAGLP